MRDDSPNQFAKNSPVIRLETEAKSLFRKILAISPYGSRFCPDRLVSANANSNENEDFSADTAKKNVGGGWVFGLSPMHDDDCRFGSRTAQSEISLARSIAAS